MSLNGFVFFEFLIILKESNEIRLIKNPYPSKFARKCGFYSHTKYPKPFILDRIKVIDPKRQDKNILSVEKFAPF